ncbi:MAG TPA: carboxypeptidase regulatory-like domain-containing protein, partial [Polyangiaceae bacterium]|nr:carboxypeptidase regulatory-like domain-containing protein [Polyangiaceae bacterium]
SHYQNMWFKHGPEPFSSLAEFKKQTDLGNVSGQVITSFPKGQAMSEWLVNAGATQATGEVAIAGAQHNIVRENPEFAQRWIATDSPEPSVQYLSANTPLGVSDAEQCGRLVISDIHVSPGELDDDISDPSEPFPGGCVTSALSPQEAVLAFMLFDLSGCVVPDDQAPVAPPVILR